MLIQCSSLSCEIQTTSNQLIFNIHIKFLHKQGVGLGPRNGVAIIVIARLVGKGVETKKYLVHRLRVGLRTELPITYWAVYIAFQRIMTFHTPFGKDTTSLVLVVIDLNSLESSCQIWQAALPYVLGRP